MRYLRKMWNALKKAIRNSTVRVIDCLTQICIFADRHPIIKSAVKLLLKVIIWWLTRNDH